MDGEGSSARHMERQMWMGLEAPIPGGEGRDDHGQEDGDPGLQSCCLALSMLSEFLVPFAAAHKQKSLDCCSRIGNWNQRKRNGMKMR